MKKRKILIYFVVIMYFLVTIINQQKVLNSYQKTQNDISEQIQEAEEEKVELLANKENANSLQYIESIAREKLNMYYPNEKVYVDNNK
ncbi:MAG: cell division protein FtsL [Clostridia bacterium]|nr:cell division protein FtsL [Clostridia bacterium]